MWIAPVFLAFAPAYFQVMMGGLTEVLFAGLLVAGLYFFSKEKYVTAALVITFLPFARSEAYFVLPFFGLAFLWQKNWRAILALALGPLLVSVLAWFVVDDFWWMITKNPYTGAKDIYGTGEPWFFLKNFGQIPGAFIRDSAAVGLVLFLAFGFFKRNRAQMPTLLLAAACGVSIVVAHSVFWWKGLYGSMGLLRVLATIIPICILFAFYAFSWASRFINSKWLIPLLLYGCYISFSNTQYLHPFAKKPEKTEKEIQQLAAWFESSKYAGTSNVWYMQPAIGYYLDIDNFNALESRQLWYLNHILPSNALKNGGLIIWDAARGPNEGKCSKEKLFADRHLKLVKSIVSEADTTLESDFLVELLVFEKQIDATNDTLAFADFNVYRPILEDRFERIKTDADGRKYFVMESFTESNDIFTCWQQDQASWNTNRFELRIDAEIDLDIYLVVLFEDGTEETIPWQAGVFALPHLKKPWVKMSLFIKKPVEKATKVYGWQLLKLR